MQNDEFSKDIEGICRLNMQCPNFNQIFIYCFNILEWLIFKICLEKYCLKDILDKSKNFLHVLYACGCYWRQSVLMQIAFSLYDKKNTQDQSRRAAVIIWLILHSLPQYEQWQILKNFQGKW